MIATFIRRGRLVGRYSVTQNSWSSRLFVSTSSLSNVASNVASNDDANSTARDADKTVQDMERGVYRLLGDKERELLTEQRALTELSRRIAREVGSVDLLTGRQFLEEFQLESTFSVVIAGEFNAGKSTLINALLGQKLLESGALPTTDCITIVGNSPLHASISEAAANESDSAQPQKDKISSSLPSGVILHQVSQDLPLLQDLTLIDTPGTNAVLMDHTARTLRLLPAADLIVFVTSADRPFPDSERTLLKSIQAYRKSIVIVINKMDILDSTGGDHGKDQKQQVVDFVTENASELLGARPIVLPVSSRDALSCKIMSESMDAVWKRSNFGALESFLRSTLTTETKLKSKLTSPLGVVDGIMHECLRQLGQQQKELETDVATLSIFQSQFVGWQKELESDLTKSRRETVDLVKLEGDRCTTLLDRINWIWDRDQFMAEWKDTQVNPILNQRDSLKKELLDQVKETADSIATRGRAQGQAVIEYLGKRPAMQNQSLVGSVTAASRFEDTRRILVDRLSEAVETTLDIDEAAEQEQLFQSLRKTAMISASLQVGTLGATVASATQLLDPITGISSAVACAATGGVLLYSGSSRIRNAYVNKWEDRASKLNEALKVICSKEMDRVNRRILDGVAPYTRFVETEQSRTDDLTERCEGVISSSRNLRNRINKL